MTWLTIRTHFPRRFSSQILCGVEYLHHRGVIHRCVINSPLVEGHPARHFHASDHPQHTSCSPTRYTSTPCRLTCPPKSWPPLLPFHLYCLSVHRILSLFLPFTDLHPSPSSFKVCMHSLPCFVLVFIVCNSHLMRLKSHTLNLT